LNFTEHFGLADHIRFEHEVTGVIKEGDQWFVDYSDGRNSKTEKFDKVIIATGLANKLKPIHSSTASYDDLDDIKGLRNKTIVVLGGGESAVDIADRLSRTELDNQVHLSLRSGVRVSPRYHPIKNVPSDFLRTRLMMSAHEDIRNAIGQWFVEMRIGYIEQRVNSSTCFTTRAMISWRLSPRSG